MLKQKGFSRWQADQGISDASLCKAVREMERGLIDADLGGALFKKRIARTGSGKSGGYRTLLSVRIGHRYVFLHGFAKCDKENVTLDELKVMRFAGKAFLELSHEALWVACETRQLLEVCCEPHH
ncbi:type II toxin-antitoxin system RelE/ParE family toxin [Luteibacter sp.]|uniref:type II toxin-antitoxin system RelE/ParE family toxin n=1 Tax=Luteibacter sp. TaxID=1886636 RepID=UPI003F815456